MLVPALLQVLDGVLPPDMMNPRILNDLCQTTRNMKSLKKCREVSKSWKKSIERINLTWIQTINIPSILQNGNTYLHVAARTGRYEIFEMIFENDEAENVKNNSFETPFSLACRNGCWKIADFLVETSPLQLNPLQTPQKTT